MKRLGVTLYSITSYAVFVASFLSMIEFLGRDLLPFGLNTGTVTAPLTAVTIDVALLLLFGAQHSIMARPGFKRRWARLVPSPVERSTYVLLSSLALLLLTWQWRALPGTVWGITALPGRLFLEGVFWFGVALTLLSTFQIDHFDLFGLRQAWNYLRGLRPAPAPLRTPFLYSLVRHPLMLGLLITFWATPRMTTGHLLFAAGMTVYVMVGLHFEERDLVRAFRADYRAYQAAVPMLIPRLPRATVPRASIDTPSPTVSAE
jgi:protein-S-isoprenylcysteine O-methyltransferase Ste14